jgi:hypothetical protein
MTTLLSQVGLYTYESYLKQFNQWVHQGQTSSKDTSPALVEFTKLNWARTQRLQKTILLNPEIKKSAEKIDHIYTWIVITEAWCGDSAQNIPVIAEIAKLNPEKIKLYIVLRDENPELMSKYLTEGARAIPKLIVLDDTLGKEVFTWGPRPKPAQEILKEWKRNPAGKSWEDFEKELHSWYAKDKTNTIQSEFNELLHRLSQEY